MSGSRRTFLQLLCFASASPAPWLAPLWWSKLNLESIFFLFSRADCHAHFIPRGKRLGFTCEDGPGSMRTLAPVSWETTVAPACGQLFASQSVVSGENVWEQETIKCSENQGFCKKLKPDTAQAQSLWEILCLWLFQKRVKEPAPHYNYAMNSCTKWSEMSRSKICQWAKEAVLYSNQLHQCPLTDTVSLQSGSDFPPAKRKVQSMLLLLAPFFKTLVW